MNTERELFEELYAPLVAKLVSSLKLPEADAEESASYALHELLRKPRAYNPSRSKLTTYIWMIASRRARKMRSRSAWERLDIVLFGELDRSGLGAIELVAACADEAVAVEDSAHRDDRLEQAILLLPDRMREVMARRAGGLSNEEIAEELGMRKGAVCTAYSRGLNWLRNRLGPPT